MLVEGFGGCPPAEGLARSGVECGGDGVEVGAGQCRERSVPFGKYWRSRPLVFSFVPRCHGLCGSQK